MALLLDNKKNSINNIITIVSRESTVAPTTFGKIPANNNPIFSMFWSLIKVI